MAMKFPAPLLDKLEPGKKRAHGLADDDAKTITISADALPRTLQPGDTIILTFSHPNTDVNGTYRMNKNRIFERI